MFSPIAFMRATFLLLVAVGLAACASGSTAISKTFGLVFANKDQIADAQLNPRLRYLRVTTEGRSVLLVLGNLESHPDGPIEVWYSTRGETLYLQNGRIFRTAGLTTDWRAVRYSSALPWQAVTEAVTIQRSHDEMPGYRMNVQELLTLTPIAPPGDSLLKDRDATTLRWFAEMPQRSGEDVLPYSRFALEIAPTYVLPVYGEQCLAANLCLSWQRWPVNGDSSYARIDAN